VAGAGTTLLVGCGLGAAADRDGAGPADGFATVSTGTGASTGGWVLCGRVLDGVGLGELIAGTLASLASVASARYTSAAVSCWLVLGAMPCPSIQTASKLPAVAAPTPSSQAPTPMKTRTCPRLADGRLRAGKAGSKHPQETTAG